MLSRQNRTSRTLRVGGALLLGALLTAGCGGDDSSGEQPFDPDSPFGTVDCSQEERAEPFEAGLLSVGAAGYTAEIVTATPMPAMRDDNAWTVRIADGGGNATPDLRLAVVPWMPDHGHGTNVIAEVTDNGDGTYELMPVNLWMPGYWEVTLELSDDSGDVDDVVVPLCLNQ